MVLAGTHVRVLAGVMLGKLQKFGQPNRALVG